MTYILDLEKMEVYKIDSDFDAQGMDITNVGALDTEQVFLGQLTSTPSDSDIGSGNTAFYTKGDGNLYKKSYGGSESQIGDGAELEAHAAGYKTSQGYRFWNLDYETMDVGDGTDARQLGQRGKYFDTKDFVFFDDFLGSALTNKWCVSQGDSGSNPTIEFDAKGGQVLFSTGATITGYSKLVTNNAQFDLSSKIRIKTRLKITDVSESALSFNLDTAKDGNNGAAHLYVDRGSIQLSTENATNTNIVDSGNNIVDNTWYDFELVYDGSKWILYQNGTNIAESSTYLPSGTAYLDVKLQCISNTDVDMYIDYIGVMQER